METKIILIARSRNAKTGAISQTYTTNNTCPTRCPFKHSGCYVENFTTKMAWDKAEKVGVTPKELAKLVKEFSTSIIRHNVGGDIAMEGTSDIDEKLVTDLCEAYKGKKAYTYTHCTVNARNIAIAKEAISKGFVINSSVETLSQAKRCHEYGVPCVLACAGMSKPHIKKEGLTLMRCPATIDKEMTCAKCGKCLKKDRKSIITFPAHGARKNTCIKFLKNY